MAISKTDYLARLIELRDAGKQLVRLFSDSVELSLSPQEWNNARKSLLEAELDVMRLEELIKKLSPTRPKSVPEASLKTSGLFMDETQKITVLLPV